MSILSPFISKKKELAKNFKKIIRNTVKEHVENNF